MIRHCTNCDTRSKWSQLPYVGIQCSIDDCKLELRNCSCGTTLAEELPTYQQARNWLTAERVLGDRLEAAMVIVSLVGGGTCDPIGADWLARLADGDTHKAHYARVLLFTLGSWGQLPKAEVAA
jgi:hypothetical protein